MYILYIYLLVCGLYSICLVYILFACVWEWESPTPKGTLCISVAVWDYANGCE